MRLSMVWVVLASLYATSMAMDGICIANIVGDETYCQQFTSGKLVKYTIVNNYVTAVDSLPDYGNSPVINKSGTYFAYIVDRNVGTTYARSLMIRPIDGRAGIGKEIPLTPGATWLWWANDGTFYYCVQVIKDGNWVGMRKIRKVTLAKVNGNLVATDILVGKTDRPIQGGFIGIDGTGKKIFFKGFGRKESDNSDGECGPATLLTGDTTKYLDDNPVFSGSGCGYSLSPSGDYFTQWAGGHNVSSWGKWSDKNSTGGWACFFSKLNTVWAKYRDTDPESKLEIQLNGATDWTKNPLGVMGEDNVWSSNSEYWHLCEIGAGRDDGDCFCMNIVAINWKDSVAINVTKIMPNSASGYPSAQTFRGITFSNGPKSRSADHPTLWCSTKADVWDSLWHFVENRDADNVAWSNLLGITPAIVSATIPAKSVVAGPPTLISSIKRSAAGLTLSLGGSGAYSVKIFDLSGRQVRAVFGSGSRLDLAVPAQGALCAEVRRNGRVARIALPVL